MSEPNGLGSESGAAAQQLAGGGAEDPWFDPGPKPNGYKSLSTDQDEFGAAGTGVRSREPGPADAAPAADGGGRFEGPHESEEWFLPAGRAGLLPESMTETWDADARAERHEAEGKPPWAGEQSARDVAEPPPWESGPWPGPGEARPAGERQSAARRSVIPRPLADTANAPATAAMIAGILPLVLPGAVLGVLGLRRAKVTGTGRRASWIGIGLSAIWAVLVIVFATGGTSAPGCTATAQATVNRAMQTVLSDLAKGAPPTAVSASMTQALGQANAAAVGTQQTAASSALLNLTNSLNRAVAVVNSSRSAANYATLRAQLAAATTAVANACGR
jgi:hypothetical protein